MKQPTNAHRDIHHNESKGFTAPNRSRILSDLAKIVVPLPVISQVSDLFTTVHDFRHAGGCIGVVEGVSQVGKSIAVRSAIASNTELNAIVILVSGDSMYSLGASILKGIGAPIIRHKYPERLSDYISRQLILRKIDFLILDNADFMASNKTTQQNLQILLTQIVQNSSCGVVFVGQLGAREVGEATAYILSAKLKVVNALPFPLRNHEDIKTMQAALYVYKSHASKFVDDFVNLDSLCTSRMARRMFMASGGRIGLATTIISGAIHDCLKNGLTELDNEVLGDAWRQTFVEYDEISRAAHINPFLSEDGPSLDEIRSSYNRNKIQGKQVSKTAPNKTRSKKASGIWTRGY